MKFMAANTLVANRKRLHLTRRDVAPVVLGFNERPMATSVRTVDSARHLGVVVDSHLTMTTHVSAVCPVVYYKLQQLRTLIRSLTSDAAKLLVQAFISTCLDYCNLLLYVISDNLYRRLVANRSKRRSTHHHQHENVRAHHARPAAATLASSPPTCAIQDRRAGVQGTARPPACVSGERLLTCVCHWTPKTAFVGHRHMHGAANQHTSWRSLIRCCWTSRMKQSANPAARVGHHTRTISESTQNASIWLLTAAALSDSVFHVHCAVYEFANYLLLKRHQPTFNTFATWIRRARFPICY